MQKGGFSAARGIRVGVALSGIVISLAATNAQAQVADTETAASSSAQDSQEILVVARRRAEALEDVPASVGVLSSEEIERLAIRDVADYTRQTPGAVLIASGPSYLSDIGLRGQGGGRLGFSESTTGIYRDGIYVAGGGFGGRSYSRIDFYDIERIEVYRGPQGALYGRNAVGGAVNVITHKPVLDYEVSARAGFNNVDSLDTSATVNVPVTDTVAVRFGGYYAHQTGGYHINEVTGNVIDDSLDWGMRGTIGAGIGTDSTAYLTVEHSRSEAPGFTSVGQNAVLDPDPFVRTGLDDVDRVVINQTQVIGEFRHDFGASELSILANYKGRHGYRTPADFDHYLGIRLPGVRLLDGQGEEFERYGAEVRWGSTGNGPLSWMAGADFMTFTSEVSSDRTGTVTGTGATYTALRRQLRRQESTETLWSYSVYGQVGYDITDRLNLSVEARFQIDDKKFNFQQIDLDPTTNETIPYTAFARNWSRFLPTASLNYRVTHDLSFYARLATGYRPGGFNQNPALGYFDRVPYDPEDILSGEVGVKGQFHIGGALFRGQLAVYYSKTDDVQQTTVLSMTNPAFTLENVGSNHVIGGELELGMQVPLAGGRFSTNFNLSGSHGTWDDGASILYSGAPIDLSGEETARTRDYIINLNAQYDHEIADGMTGLLTASYQTAAGGYDDASLTRESENYSILDLSAGIRTEHWSILGYVKNVTNDIYRVVILANNNYYNTPRTYGVTFSVNW